MRLRSIAVRQAVRLLDQVGADVAGGIPAGRLLTTALQQAVGRPTVPDGGDDV
jgi:hypothetical protein